ncbi:hypothetical protein J3R30DRAFT_1358875 [Lentinula aciculospora]|uniref:Histone deacetylase complex subunit SAP30 Sin3 binding domain-containing protein n=1 Tax=Lentinula aciculospora TaxID=153920 RepID=A0A9W9ALU1_9AGAR|nr:hypothetical protein J3R30DRAFT_1358875 [Lentinula aciculospora]
MSGATQSASSRSRNQNRKKANEDASYIGPAAFNAAGVKRQAADRAEGDSSRVKRKKVEQIPIMPSKLSDNDNKISLVDFAKMPSPFVHRYLSTFDLIPTIRPLPNTVDEPPPPYSLGSNFQQPSRAPSPIPITTPANRPRRELHPKDQSRIRSSRLSDEDNFFQRTPILADVNDLHIVLAGIAEKHFREMAPINGREEVDTLAAFMFAVDKAKGGRFKH